MILTYFVGIFYIVVLDNSGIGLRQETDFKKVLHFARLFIFHRSRMAFFKIEGAFHLETVGQQTSRMS